VWVAGGSREAALLRNGDEGREAGELFALHS
jgi:hypothetical protein